MNIYRKIMLSTFTVFIVAAGLYDYLTIPVYEATGSIMVKRAQPERSGTSTEESRNRWVWVRDGLELRNHLQSETVLNAVVKTILDKPDSTSVLNGQNLSEKLQIHYAGGDENVFTFKIKDRDRIQAQTVITQLMEVFPSLAIDTKTAALRKSLKEIDSLIKLTDKKDQVYVRKIAIAKEIRTDLLFAEAERSSRVVVIRHPVVEKVWPRKDFIFAVAAFFSMFVSCVIIVFMDFLKIKKERVLRS